MKSKGDDDIDSKNARENGASAGPDRKENPRNCILFVSKTRNRFNRHEAQRVTHLKTVGGNVPYVRNRRRGRSEGDELYILVL